MHLKSVQKNFERIFYFQKISRNKYQSNKPGILKHFACSRILTKQNQGINTDDDYPLSELPEGESFIIYSPIDRIANYPISPKKYYRPRPHDLTTLAKDLLIVWIQFLGETILFLSVLYFLQEVGQVLHFF